MREEESEPLCWFCSLCGDEAAGEAGERCPGGGAEPACGG
ncbi:rubrerythrin [Streptomyces filamentosus]